MIVLVAVDMGPGSDKVLGFATELAKQTSGELHVVHVVTDDEKKDRADMPGEGHYLDVMMEEAKRNLEKKLTELGLEQSSFTAITRTGDLVDEIRRVGTEYSAEMLVIGMRRRSRVGKLLLGSDLQELLMSSDRPVVAVPTDSFD